MPVPAIRINHLTKDFAHGVRGVKIRAVEDLSLEVGNNEIFGLLGPNGSGKTTTIKVMLGLLKPTRGGCEIFGVDSDRVRSRIDVGFLPDAPYFYRFLTGRELVTFFAKICGLDKSEINDRVDAVIEMVDMEDAANRRVGTYSKGMLQRIGLAQALVHDPRLVILDEPTAGVDPIGSADIADIIGELKKRGKTVFLCSHMLSQIEQICDRIAILHRGKLILKGSVDELLQRSNQKSIQLENYNEEIREPLRTFLSGYGVRLMDVQTPRKQLHELFLAKVPGSGARKKSEEKS